MKEKSSKKKTIWLVVSVVVLCILVTSGIYSYTKFLKKSTAELLDAVPADATFVLQINDNEGFVKSIAPCMAYLEDFFSLDALPGFEYFIDITRRNMQNDESLVISGHTDENGKQAVLLSMKMDELAYKHLIKELSVNMKDYSTFAGQKIYNVDTHYKNFKFTYHNGLFSACSSQQVLEAAIKCLANEKCIAAQPDFKRLQEVIHKNTKQNWLILQQQPFMESHLAMMAEYYQLPFQSWMNRSKWSAYQIQLTESEMILSGYSFTDADELSQSMETQGGGETHFPEQYIPANITNYCSINFTDDHVYASQRQMADSVRLQFLKLHAQSIQLFYWEPDSCNVEFAIVQCNDTLEHTLDFLPDSLYADSITYYKRLPIYRSGIPHFAEALPMPTAAEMNYFMINQGYYIFSESLGALKKYIDNCKDGKTLEKNQYYLFSKENLPTEYSYEVFYQNLDHTNSSFFPFRIFAYSFDEKMGDLLPNKIYIKFAVK
ncbi:MAG: hypothetical protein IJT04_02830 [Bacteroidales bacterium]|nr:hypothetical protein [Bacteroidales bacterium]